MITPDWQILQEEIDGRDKLTIANPELTVGF
jgi:hypothetical protein